MVENTKWHVRSNGLNFIVMDQPMYQLELCPSEPLFAADAASKARSVLSNYAPDKWIVSYSGGSDSDTVMWFLRSIGFEPKGVFFNTGFEWQATKRHIAWMRAQGFNIVEEKAHKSIPVAIKQYGIPFWSKYVSEMLHRLIAHGFDFEDGPLDELSRRYPNARAALRWWTNDFGPKRCNIAWNPGLKEFLIANPPRFPVHSACCEYSKKRTARKFAKDNGIELMVTGIRKAEGGIRAIKYAGCFQSKNGHNDFDTYMPLFWWSNRDKLTWDRSHGVRHSDCYTVYGLDRTGCAACPYGADFEGELAILERHEPLLYKAANRIFGESYSCMRAFEQFRKGLRESTAKAKVGTYSFQSINPNSQ